MQGYETFCYHSVGVLNLRNIFKGYETILLLILKIFCVAVKVCDMHLLNEALGAYFQNIQYPKHIRQSTLKN